MGPGLHACRTLGVWPKNIHAGNLTISHKKGMKERSENKQQGFSPPPAPTAQKEIQFEIFQHCTASDCAHYYSPFLSVASSSPPSKPLLPFIFSYFSLSPLPSHSPSLFPLLLCQAPSSLLRDETESVGLIIPNQSFASTSLPALLASSWSALPSEITSRHGTHSWILLLLPPLVLFKFAEGKRSVWWGQRGSMLPLIGVNCMHTENVIYISGC